MPLSIPVCRSGEFKEGFKSVPCSPCPNFSSIAVDGSSQCTCDPGYYRGRMESAGLPCACEFMPSLTELVYLVWWACVVSSM